MAKSLRWRAVNKMHNRNGIRAVIKESQVIADKIKSGEIDVDSLPSWREVLGDIESSQKQC